MSTRHRAFGFSAYKTLRQHRTIPALRLKHRSGSCGTASALPKCSIMSGCGTRHRASGAKAPRTLRPLPLLRFAVSATGGAHLCSIQYYLRFWLGICRTSLAVSALRIMRYCLNLLILRVMLRGKRQLAIDSAGRLLGGTDFICQAHQPRFTAGGWDGG